jgi:hypothetical protein
MHRFPAALTEEANPINRTGRRYRIGPLQGHNDTVPENGKHSCTHLQEFAMKILKYMNDFVQFVLNEGTSLIFIAKEK